MEEQTITSCGAYPTQLHTTLTDSMLIHSALVDVRYCITKIAGELVLANLTLTAAISLSTDVVQKLISRSELSVHQWKILILAILPTEVLSDALVTTIINEVLIVLRRNNSFDVESIISNLKKLI